MKKRSILILCFAMTAFCVMLLSSCSGTGGVGDDDMITVVDMEGTEVTIPKNVDTVACISPSATDLMIAFGLGDKIVGTYRSFLYNPWAAVIAPEASDYKPYSYSVSAEELLADGVDLVILQDTENAEALRNAGIPVVAVHQYSPTGAFDDKVYDTARLLGEIFGGEAKEKADVWIRDVESAIAEIRSVIGTESSERTVYYVNGEKDKGLFYSDGGNSMISRVLDIAGVCLATEQYEVLNVHAVSDEEMLSLDPFAMLIGGAYQNNLMDELASSEIWSALACSRENRVYRIPVAMIGIENVSAETPVMLRYAASLFCDDYEYDLKAGLKENIRQYFGYELSDADVENMCRGLDSNGERMVDAAT